MWRRLGHASERDLARPTTPRRAASASATVVTASVVPAGRVLGGSAWDTTRCASQWLRIIVAKRTAVIVCIAGTKPSATSRARPCSVFRCDPSACCASASAAKAPSHEPSARELAALSMQRSMSRAWSIGDWILPPERAGDEEGGAAAEEEVAASSAASPSPPLKATSTRRCESSKRPSKCARRASK